MQAKGSFSEKKNTNKPCYTHLISLRSELPPDTLTRNLQRKTLIYTYIYMPIGT